MTTQQATRTRIRQALFLLSGSVIIALAAFIIRYQVYPPQELCQFQSSPLLFQDASKSSAAFERLRQKTTEIKKNSSASRELVAERFNDLRQVVTTDPAKALEMILPPSKRRLPKADPGCVEQSVTVEGILEIVHADDFVNKKELMRYFLRSDKGRLEFFPANDLRDGITPQSKIRIAGFKIGKTVLTDGQIDLAQASTTAVSEPIGIESVQPVVATAITGNKRVLIVPVDFRNTTTTVPTPARLNDLLNASTSSIHDYYDKNSYNNVNVYGDVVNRIQINVDKTCDVEPLTTTMVQALFNANHGISLAPYQNLVFVLPNAGCDWGGLGTVGSQTIWTPIGYVTLGVSWNGTYDYQPPWVMIHELGHNFGTHHANFLNCGAVPIAPSCTDVEYGDYLDVMGAYGHMSLNRKLALGWVNNSNLPLINSTQTITISPRATDTTPGVAGTTDVKGVRVQTGGGRVYTVEYRHGNNDAGTPTDSYDSGIMDSTDNTWGAIAVQIPHPTNSIKTALVDPIIGDHVDNHFLPINRTFTDEYGVTITLTSKSVSSAQIRVYVPPALFNHPPSLAPIPNQIAYVGVGMAINLSATDPDHDFPLTFTSPNLPAGANLSSQGYFWWIPAAGTPYLNYVTFVVSDGRGGTASQSTTILVDTGTPPGGGGGCEFCWGDIGPILPRKWWIW